MLLPIHVVAGSLAIILGAVALLVKKGGPLHRRSGVLFVCTMLVMAITAAMLGNVVGGLITIYFLLTAWTTVQPLSTWVSRINASALIVALTLALLAIAGGIRDIGTPGLSSGGVPFRIIGGMAFVLAGVLLLSAIGDARLMRSGPLRGGPRLARHLWRMCFALFIAAGSFFSIEERVAKILPEPFTSGPMRLLPILLVFGAMFYWLWRLRSRRGVAVAA
jgi:uncharacterized membrane protein